MTVPKRRYIISGFADEYADISLELFNAFKKIRENRNIIMPSRITEKTTNDALYNYGDVLMFQIAMICHGHNIREASEYMNIPTHRLRRVLKKYDYGRLTNVLRLPKKDNSYIVHQMLNYIDEAEQLLKYQLPEHQRYLWDKKKGRVD